MIALRIAGATHHMMPPDTTNGDYAIFVKREDDAWVSRWEPTPEELTVLNAGGSVELWIKNDTHPLVALQTAEKE